MNQAVNTGDKLILAAIDLISEQGYDGTTTKEIAAAAGFSEVTLFRHFGSKEALLVAAFERYHYAGEMTKLFNERLTWDVRTDLLLIGRTYHSIMNRNRKLLNILNKGGIRLPEEVHKHASQHPVQLKILLRNYFSTLLEQGKIAQVDPEITAMSYMWMNLGAFSSNLVESSNSDVTLDTFIERSVDLFARALAP
ncbi:TetR/AcrR family transcriptional regulator [Paenibacillus nasutitermitis]|uniref:TetR family transcriptional regulator n=1 Tax=Paenibacillus nasutitermitis TaxID=1652958 RepID=A0A916ZKJ5_9BACL|nr:TetR/AcrR family transcriptional regulator [Paenibacillus nasutitermitis]GGE02322.1 TetR family transcriptional regulator [Paenibacillus nasutitermitis]